MENINISKETVELISACIIGLLSVFGAIGAFLNSKGIKKVQKGVKRAFEANDYNTNRSKHAEDLKVCAGLLEHKAYTHLDFTTISKIQFAFKSIQGYSNIISKEERKRIDRVLWLIKKEDCDRDEMLEILEIINGFIAKLGKDEDIYELR